MPPRRSTRRRGAEESGEQATGDAAAEGLAREQVAEPSSLHISALPDHLLLEVFRQLVHLAPVLSEDDEAIYSRRLPFWCREFPGERHPGLRAYPFLAQVCRQWRSVLDSPAAVQALWEELTIDFGHELITAVHVPIAWSDVRPTDEEFAQALVSTRLRAHRLVAFVRQRRASVRRLALVNSEGYWDEEGNPLPLAGKHNFSQSTFGLLLGMLQDSLTGLYMKHCNDLLGMGTPLSTVAMLTGLRSLALEDLHCHLYREPLAELGRLTQLTELRVCVSEHEGLYDSGLESIPDSWQQLASLCRLELRQNVLLQELPLWLPAAFPGLELLDVSGCLRLDLGPLTALTQLRTLALHGMTLVHGPLPAHLAAEALPGMPPLRTKALPCLAGLTSLRALNLAENFLTEVPAFVFKLTQLEVLDLGGNSYLSAPAPLTPLLGLTRLRWLDMRDVCYEAERFWSTAKCTTMQHLAKLSKAIKRRRATRHATVLF